MMRATTLSAAAIALPAVTASRQDAAQALVLLQQRAALEDQISWDVKAWFDKLRHKQNVDAATDETKATSKVSVNESLASNDTSHACDDWCAEDSYVKLEAGVEVTKNISSWSMKCKWLHCNGCSQCDTAANTTTIEKIETSLSQESVEVTTENNANYGNTVPVTEAGYQTVAALKDDHQMKQFIFRVAQSEARFIKEAAELNGLVPYYSGTTAVQSLGALQNDLRKAWWVLETEGRRAPLSEAGYKKVASMMSKPDMVAFARRVLDMAHVSPTDEAAFVEHVSHFNGESGRSFADLQHSLVSASWTRAREMPKEQQAAEPVVPEQAAVTDDAKQAKRGKGKHAHKEEPVAPPEVLVEQTKSKRGKGGR